MFPQLPKSFVPIVLLVLHSGLAAGQGYPGKPIRIVTSEVGGSADIGGRIIAQGISGPLGQAVIIDNRGSGVIPGEIVARARPDGHTLLIFGGTHWLQPLMRKHVPYDPVKDFSPITITMTQPSVLIVHPSLPVRSVKELIALARAKPGELNNSSGALGSASHLAAELFKIMAGVNIVSVPYRGTGPAVAGVIANQVQLMFPTASAALTHVQSGRLRMLAVTSALPSPVVPDVPTIASSGLPGYENVSTIAMFAPARTPPAIVSRLNREIVSFLQTAETRERFLRLGAEAVGSTPAELDAKVKSEMSRIAKLMKDTGMRPE